MALEINGAVPRDGRSRMDKPGRTDAAVCKFPFTGASLVEGIKPPNAANVHRAIRADSRRQNSSAVSRAIPLHRAIRIKGIKARRGADVNGSVGAYARRRHVLAVGIPGRIMPSFRSVGIDGVKYRVITDDIQRA